MVSMNRSFMFSPCFSGIIIIIVIHNSNNNKACKRKPGENGTAVLCPLNAEVRLQWAYQSFPCLLSAAVTDHYQAFQADVPSSHNTLKIIWRTDMQQFNMFAGFPQHLIIINNFSTPNIEVLTQTLFCLTKWDFTIIPQSSCAFY